MVFQRVLLAGAGIGLTVMLSALPVAWLMVLPARGADAASPATVPTAGSAAASDASSARDRIARCFAQLGDDRSDVREAARWSLLQLQAEDLPLLQRVVADNVPLQPSQLASLRSIVIHVFLKGLPYQKTSDGFLGVLFEDLPDDGARVARRWPGNCGFGALEEGDIVMAVDLGDRGRQRARDVPGAEAQWPHIEIHTALQMRQIMSQTSPGEQITLTLQRRGRTLRVPIKVDARPADPPDENLENLGQQRMEAGADYWNDNFVPLLGGGVS